MFITFAAATRTPNAALSKRRRSTSKRANNAKDYSPEARGDDRRVGAFRSGASPYGAGRLGQFKIITCFFQLQAVQLPDFIGVAVFLIPIDVRPSVFEVDEGNDAGFFPAAHPTSIADVWNVL